MIINWILGNTMSKKCNQRQVNTKFLSIISVYKVLGISILLVASQIVSADYTYAANTVGEAIKIKNSVTASNGNRKLSKSDKVFAKEKITAAINSHGQLLLNDNSKVIIGENSIVSLDDFVVSKGGISKGTFKVAKGAMRLISGNGPKGKYQIKTPVATIGVRGTALDVFVRANGETDIILYNGVVQACSSSACITSRRVCDVVNIKPSGAISKLSSFRYTPSQEDAENIRYSSMWPQKDFVKTHQVREWVCKTNAVNDFLGRKGKARRLTEEDKDDIGVEKPAEVKDDDDYPTDNTCGVDSSGC